MILTSLSTRLDPAFGKNGDSVGYIDQRSWTIPEPAGYGTSSGADSLGNIPYLNMLTTFAWLNDDTRQLGTTIETSSGVNLLRSSPQQISRDDAFPLDRTIAEWRPQSASDPWFMQLQIQTDARSNTVFRLCWHMRLPQVIRLSCTKHDRLTGADRGIFLVDDSNGLGARTWETQ